MVCVNASGENTLMVVLPLSCVLYTEYIRYTYAVHIPYIRFIYFLYILSIRRMVCHR